MAFVSLDLFETETVARSTYAVPRVAQLAGVESGVEGLRRLEGLWRKLEGASGGGQAFLTYGFALAAARYHEARGERVLFSVADWNDRPACILPVAVTRRSGVSVGVFLGDPIVQYGDALTVAAAPARTAELALRSLMARAPVDVFEFRRVRSDAAILPALARLAKPAGPAVEAPWSDLTRAPSVDALLLDIGGAKQRRERQRSRRRLAERGELRFEALRGAAAIGSLREAFRLKREWLARNGEVSPVIEDDKALRAFEQLARDPGDGASLVVCRLSVGGVAAAYEVGLIRGRRFHAYLGAVAEAFAGASPGKVVMEDAFNWCRDNGVEAYDLLPPGDPYKARWATGSVEVRNFVAPRTLLGRAYAGPWLTEVRPRLRAALDGLPTSLRRRVGRVALQAGAC